MVQIQEVGETIHFCTSDNSIQEEDVDGQRIDRTPGARIGGIGANPNRARADIYLYPPEPFHCDNGAQCPAEQVCVDQTTRLPAAANGEMQAGELRCAYAYEVNPTGGLDAGYCNATLDDPMYHQHSTDQVGAWRFDFVGDIETLIPGARSTRYFEIDVRDSDGVTVPNGRVHSRQWLLNAHLFENSASPTLFIHRPSRSAVEVVVLELDRLQGGQYILLANRNGLEDFEQRSYCQFGDPSEARCPAPQAGDQPQTVFAEYMIYLSFPAIAVGEADPLVPLAFRLNDEVGTASFSPDGDGIQDSITLEFDSPDRGQALFFLDLNGDVEITAQELVFTADVEPGLNRLQWDGRHGAGDVVPEGEYGFQFMLRTSPVHVPLADIELNDTGFTIASQRDSSVESRALLPMHWNDAAVRTADDLLDANDVLTTPLFGSDLRPDSPFKRRWVQPGFPEDDLPVVFDTWIWLMESATDSADCVRCMDPVGLIRIGGENESPDSDNDGLLDDEEDIDGDGELDPGETDPNNPDTDGDGLLDGLESESATDPNNPDTDGDGLGDGDEDLNRNGIQDTGETDPNNADSDGDGILDGDDESPLSPERDPADAGMDERMLDAGFSTRFEADSSREPAFGADGGTDPLNRSIEFDKLGCSCRIETPADRPPFTIMILLIASRFWTRRRRSTH